MLRLYCITLCMCSYRLFSILFLGLSVCLPVGVSGQSRASTIATEAPASVSDPDGPAVLVTLSQPVYRIKIDPKTGAPLMPKEVRATAKLCNWPEEMPQPESFTWKVTLTWEAGGVPTQHSIGQATWIQASPLKIDFGEEVRGGLLTVTASVSGLPQTLVGEAKALVLGENPPRKMVLKAFPPNRFGLLASKIGMVESGLRQFTEPRGLLDPGGLPVVSRSNDVGMMQLNAPTGAVTCSEEVWDWRANLQRGLLMLQGKQRNSVLASRHATLPRSVPTVSFPAYEMVAFLNAARLWYRLPVLSAPLPPPLSDKLGSGILPGEPDPDKLALSQLEREAVRRYNGGREYTFAIVPDLAKLGIQSAGWQVDPTRGGIAPTSGAPDYVLRVLAARSGFTLPPPPKPKPAKKGKRYHSPRHRKH